MSVADADKLTVEIVLKGSIAAGGSNAQACLNVFHFRRDNNTNPLTKANVLTAFDTAYMPTIVAQLHTDYTISQLLARMLEDDLDPYSIKTISRAGAIATARAPDYECVTVQLRTGVRGLRGSKHFSPIVEAATDKDLIDAASLAAWQGVRDICVAPFTDSDVNKWTPFVWSPTNSTLAGDLWTIAGATVVSTVLNKTLGTVRSRKAATVV